MCGINIINKLDAIFRNEKNLDKLFCVFIFIISFIKMVSFIDINTATHPNRITPYILSYSNIGFANRLFLGSIISIFFKYIQSSTIITVVINFRILFLILLSYLYYRILRQIDNNIKKIMYLLIAIFAFFLTDVFLEFFCIIGIVLMLRLKCNFWIITIVPIICGIATHSIFIFLFFPAFFICLLYNVIKLNTTNNKKITLMFINLSPIIICFLLFMFYQKLKVGNPEEMIDIISQKSFYGEYIKDHYKQVYNYLNYEYFLSFFDNVKFYNPYKPEYLTRWYQLTFLLVVLMLSFGRVWLMCLNRSTNIQMKIVFLIVFLSIFSVLPMSLVGIDFVRWTDGIIASQFIILFAMVYLKDQTLLQTIETLYFQNESLSFIMFLLLLIVCMLCNWQRSAGEITIFKNFFTNIRLLL